MNASQQRAALEQRADRAAQDWRSKADAEDLGTLLANFTESEVNRLSTPAQRAPAAVDPDGYNGCMRVAAQALDFLADHERPAGGQQSYNSEHLMQLASELRKTSAALTSTPSEPAQRAPTWLDGKGAAAAADAICDYADNNLSMFEACSDEDPVKAKEIYEAAKRLRDLLAPAVTSTDGCGVSK